MVRFSPTEGHDIGDGPQAGDPEEGRQGLSFPADPCSAKASRQLEGQTHARRDRRRDTSTCPPGFSGLTSESSPFIVQGLPRQMVIGDRSTSMPTAPGPRRLASSRPETAAVRP